jgi:fused signal recognition particle receptor
MSLFSRLKDGLQRTTQQLKVRFGDVLATPAAPTDASLRTATVDTFETLEEALISADVGVVATARIVGAVKARAARGQDLRGMVKEEILRIFDGVSMTPATSVRPRVVLIVGVNGTGKTTTVGKLARVMKEDGATPVICAADTFRAAAVEQLSVWAQRAGVDMVRAQSGSDPAAVVFDALSAAKSRQRDVVLVDTAGRLHTRANLMHELNKIRRIAAREVEGAPHDVWLVLDATVGQNGLAQAREFMEVAGVNGIVLTKLDGTARGGIAVAIAQELRLPIKYVGVGEGMNDLLPFTPSDYVDALFEDAW